jgi:hypothetical protein
VKNIKFLLSLVKNEYLILNIPIVSRNRVIYNIPDELTELAKNNPKFFINSKCMDEGPITKLLPTLRNQMVKDDDIIIVIDDDRIYKKKTFEILGTLADKYSESIITFCLRKIQGHLGFSSIKKNLKPLINYNFPIECIKIDDFILNKFAEVKKIPIKRAFYTRSNNVKCIDICTNNPWCNVERAKSRALAFAYKAPQLYRTTNRINANAQCNKVLKF